MTPVNGLMADESELRAVYQVTGEVMNKIRPFVCALPTDDFRLNVNTLTEKQAPLLEAMFAPSLSESDAKQLLDKRPFDGWNTVDAFMAEPAIVGVSAEVSKKAKGIRIARSTSPLERNKLPKAKCVSMVSLST